MNYKLASAIIKGKWAVDPLFAINSISLVNDLLAGNIDVFDENKSSAASPDTNPDTNISVINISGTLFKNDLDCGPVGMATIGNVIKSLDNNDSISGIILKIDSPGGTVDGTSELANIIKATKKPIIGFVDGLMASAALWIGSSCDEIIASNDFAEIGSVGVLMSFTDFQPALEKDGVKFHTITAPQSSEKIKLFQDLRDGKYDEFKNDVLSPLAEDFISTIKSNRPLVEDKHLKGKMFFAKDVLGAFVDHIGSFDFAMERMMNLISLNNKSTYKKMETNLAIQGLLDCELQSTDEGTFLNDDQLAQINTALESNSVADDALATANDQLATVTEQFNQANADLDAANLLVDSLKKEIETLKTKPGAETAAALNATDKIVETTNGNVTGDILDLSQFAANLDAIKKEFF